MWPAVMEESARLQREVSAHADAILETGIPEVRPERIGAVYDSMFETLSGCRRSTRRTSIATCAPHRILDFGDAQWAHLFEIWTDLAPVDELRCLALAVQALVLVG